MFSQDDYFRHAISLYYAYAFDIISLQDIFRCCRYIIFFSSFHYAAIITTMPLYVAASYIHFIDSHDAISAMILIYAIRYAGFHYA